MAAPDDYQLQRDGARDDVAQVIQACRVIAHIVARPGERLSIPELSRQTGFTENHIRHLMVHPAFLMQMVQASGEVHAVVLHKGMRSMEEILDSDAAKPSLKIQAFNAVVRSFATLAEVSRPKDKKSGPDPPDSDFNEQIRMLREQFEAREAAQADKDQ